MGGAYRHYYPSRPTPLTIVGVISLLASGMTVLAVILKVVFATAIGFGTWLLGPVVGVIGSAVGFWMIVTTILQSLLSLILFSAALKVFDGDYRGRSLHQLWAWITIILNGFGLLIGSGLSRLGWWSLIYALIVLYVMNLPEVLAYFFGVEFGKPRPVDDWNRPYQ